MRVMAALPDSSVVLLAVRGRHPVEPRRGRSGYSCVDRDVRCTAVDMAELRIGHSNSYLLLTPDDLDPVGPTVTAELSSNGLRAIHAVVHSFSTGFADLAEFFDQLAQDWRGWDDVRSWQALEGDLNIDARHEYGHVQLRVTLRAYVPGWGNDGWTASANLTIDPSEQLSQIAADMGRLAACWGHPQFGMFGRFVRRRPHRQRSNSRHPLRPGGIPGLRASGRVRAGVAGPPGATPPRRCAGRRPGRRRTSRRGRRS